MIAYGGSNTIATYDTSTNPTGATMYSEIGPSTSPNFLLAGYHYYGSFGNGGLGGDYWSATSDSSASSAHSFEFNSSIVYSADADYRCSGFSVRCLLR